jgi:SagB-type dehydrogenase family enzyme
MNPSEELTVRLSPFDRSLGFPLAEAVACRRSLRAFSPGPLPLDAAAQLLWAAQGISGPEGKRTCPSAGGILPLETRFLAGDVGGLASGLYRYLPDSHSLAIESNGDFREELAKLCVDQTWIATAPAAIILSAHPAKMAKKYGAASSRYIAMEAGHVGQNVHLIAEALGLGTTMVAAFRAKPFHEWLGCEPDEEPLYVMPVGRKPEAAAGP